MNSNDQRHGLKSRGFTLIELLVVIAVISILISVLLPALGKARELAQQAGSASMQRSLFTAMTAYTESNDTWIPGVNTSGLDIFNVQAPTSYEKMDGNPEYPVQAFDWISPIMGSELPPGREARMWYMWENYADPAMDQNVAVWPGGGFGTSQALDYTEQFQGGDTWPGVSFLMPGSWQFAGSLIYNEYTGFAKQLESPFAGDQVSMPDSYRPRTIDIGNLSLKIAFGDGFRYHDGDLIDFDASVKVSLGGKGAFTSSGAIYADSTAYGVPGVTNHDNQGAQLPLSYRHGGRMDAVHWDGHVGLYTVEQSHNPDLWYPTGSIWQGNQAQPDSDNYYQQGEKIN